jgi:hypothetical protein
MGCHWLPRKKSFVGKEVIGFYGKSLGVTLVSGCHEKALVDMI